MKSFYRALIELAFILIVLAASLIVSYLINNIDAPEVEVDDGMRSLLVQPKDSE